jgi:RNA polymerase sigma-70 factor (ECF subfamily)
MKMAPAGAVDAGAAEDAALVARVAAGDSGDPMVALYQRYGSRLYGLGMRLLGDGSLAEEMVQETFIRLWRGAERFDPGKGSVSTFTFTIARRVAIDLRRRAAARPQQSRVEGADAAIEDDRAFEKLILGLDVRDALSSLSAKHREILELHFDDDLTQERIAKRLDIPLGTVKTRTYYGLRAMKLELEERGLIG